MAKKQSLTPAQQNIIRSLTAERTRAITTHDAAIAEYLTLLKTALKLKGEWTWGGTMGGIQLVRVPKPPVAEEPAA